MKIKFTESVTVPAGRDPELNFKKGSVHDLSDASAWRWVRRNMAVYYVVEEVRPTLNVGRPMMAEKKRGRPKKDAEAAKPPKEAPGKVLGVTQRNIGPALPVTGKHSGGPGWDD